MFFMKKYCLLLLFTLFINNLLRAQTAADYAVQITAAVQETPPQIKLSWKPLSGATAYLVYRKAKAAPTWGTAVATLSGADTVYTDNSVTTDTVYEYRVTKQGGSITAYGYICAGIAAPPVHNRGALLLLVDSLFPDSCAAEIEQLMSDIRGDGWQPVRRDIPRSWRDTAVRALIRSTAQAYADLSAVFLLGHIAVPYSGNINPDGHPDHLGAWPADVYYATANNTWTDVSVNSTAAAQARHHNVPGDGKWDQGTLPSVAALQLGRVDFNDMPAFGRTEVQLMKSYLNRLHQYKMDSLQVVHRGLIDDHFGVFSGEAFAGNGWRNFPPLVGRENVEAAALISGLNNASYQWSYGCGGGTYTSASGVGTTADFAAGPVNGIFMLLFGSYFGDWDAQNSFLRAPLCASTPALAVAWAGRPHWHLHHMALGENIGYSTRLTQNNSSTYVANYFPTGVHIALMGDPTLRTDYIRPAAGLTVTTQPAAGAALSWTAAPDTGVAGYYVYRSDSRSGRYALISPLVTATAFQDAIGTDGLKYYMVRPVKKTATPSGSYYNLGIGITDSATVTYPPAGIAQTAGTLAIALYPNPAASRLYITADSRQASPAQIRITDMQGRVMDSYHISLQQGKQEFSLPVQHLPAGMYLLHIATDGQTIIRKFLRQ